VLSLRTRWPYPNHSQPTLLEAEVPGFVIFLISGFIAPKQKKYPSKDLRLNQLVHVLETGAADLADDLAA
jgi:hypothetical protein